MNKREFLQSSESSWMMVWNGSKYELVEGYNPFAEDESSDESVDKASERKFQSRSEAARYAARVRWGNRGETFDANAVPTRSKEETDAIVNGLFPEKPSSYFYPEDLAIIRGYQIDGSLVNDSLRGGATDKDLPAAVKLDQAFLRPDNPLDQDIVLHRGVAVHRSATVTEVMQTRKFFNDLEVGESFTDKAFLSTSTDSKIAADFSTLGITLEVVVRKGTPVLPVPHIMRKGTLAVAFGNESEVLLPRNGTFKVVGVKSNGAKKTIRVLADFPTPEWNNLSEDE